MRKKGRVYRVYKRDPRERGYVEYYFCGCLVPEALLRFSAFGGEPMCPACKRREEEYRRKRYA